MKRKTGDASNKHDFASGRWRKSRTIKCLGNWQMRLSEYNACRFKSSVGRADTAQRPGMRTARLRRLDWKPANDPLVRGAWKRARQRAASKNLIEKLFSCVREIGRRVSWQSGAERNYGDALSAAGVLEAERDFRKIAGYPAMPILVAALRARDTRTERQSTIGDAEKAA